MSQREAFDELREDVAVFVLPARPPFRLDLTAWALRRRPDNLIDRWDGHAYRRVLLLGQSRSAAEVAVEHSAGLPERPKVRVTVSGLQAGNYAERDVRAQLERTLGLGADLQGFYQLAEADPTLARLVDPFRGVKPPRFPTVFEALANAIACQQLSLSFGILLLNRLTEHFGRGSSIARIDAGENGEERGKAFPAPEDLAGLSPEALRPLGFSQQKARALIEIARAVVEGRQDLEGLKDLDNGAALTRLRELQGIGRWSAEYVLLRGLGRLDVFPGDDVGARNRLQQQLGLPAKLNYDEVQRIVARWRPYSGLIYFHLLLHGLEDRGAMVLTR